MKYVLLASAALLLGTSAARAQTFNSLSLNQWVCDAAWAPGCLLGGGGMPQTTPAVASTGGALVLTAPGDRGLAGAIVTTHGTFSRTYGFFQITAKMPATPGSVAAFWLNSTEDGATPPEIDIAKVMAGSPASLTNELRSSAPGAAVTPTVAALADPAGVHRYAVNWQADTITWYLDGNQVAQQPTPADLHKPMYLVLEVLNGSAGTLPGATSDAAMTVTAVEVRDPAGAAAPPAIASCAPPATVANDTPAGVATTNAATGAFAVANGQVRGPDGKPFTAHGLNVMHGNGDPSAAQIQAAFPGTNFVRLAIYNYDSPAALAGYVNDLTSHGIVVELENHNNGSGNAGGATGSVFAGAQLAQEQAWYAAVAGAFRTNSRVWLGTNNEPSQSPSAAALSDWQGQTYRTIRDAGNTNPIMVEMNCWSSPSMTCGAGYTASTYAGMRNIVWDPHYYGWLSNYSTDQGAVSQNLAQEVAATQQIKSADGTVPVIIGEYGNSTTGQSIDANGNQVVTAVQQAAASGLIAGSAAWAWGSGNPGDGLTNGNTPSAYGRQVADGMAGGSPLAPATVIPAQACDPLLTAAQDGTPSAQTAERVTPGHGSVQDAQGNRYAITAGGAAQVNGRWLPGGGDTAALAIVNGTLYGRDDGHGPINPGGWFTFKNGYWTPSNPPSL